MMWSPHSVRPPPRRSRIAHTFMMMLALSGLLVGLVAWWAEDAFTGSTIGVY